MGSVRNRIKSERIQLSFDIFDIYRIDISCDFITDQLYQKISTKYSNRFKKCSLASLKKDVNDNLKNSIDKSNQTTTINYQPVFDYPMFDPFNDESLLQVLKDDPNFSHVLKTVEDGGIWAPRMKPKAECQEADLDHIVFIIPFNRLRLDNLRLFLINIHRYLQTTVYPFKYRVLIAEQSKNERVLFNKGRLINTAIKYSLENFERVDCFVIHDVDLIPSMSSEQLSELGDYRCRQMPLHLSSKVFLQSTRSMRQYNQFLTGGILSLRPNHLIAANGYSNVYFGWGAEDDDWTLRMFNLQLCIMRPQQSEKNSNAAAFTMLAHPPSTENKRRLSILSQAIERQPSDGLSNIKSLTKITHVTYMKLFTHLLVDVDI
jgi:hypothetical protein